MLSTNPWYTFQIDLARAIWAILPATLFWGASFPLALGAAASRERDSAQLVGSVYAANTAGAIVGALAFSMILIPWFGTQQCGAHPDRDGRAGGAGGAGAAGVVAALDRRRRCRSPLRSVSPGFWRGACHRYRRTLIACGRRIMTSRAARTMLYTGEGMNSSIAISVWSDGATQFHVSGKVEASTEPYDMRLQRMLGHLPALLHPDPQNSAGGGIRRRRHGGHLCDPSRGPAHRDLRDGTADPAGSHANISAMKITT